MNQPILTFSPDGGQHVYAFTGKLSWFGIGLLVVVGCCALALVKVYEIAMSLLNFILTASPESLMKIAIFVVLVATLPFVVKWLRASLVPQPKGATQ